MDPSPPPSSPAPPPSSLGPASASGDLPASPLGAPSIARASPPPSRCEPFDPASGDDIAEPPPQPENPPKHARARAGTRTQNRGQQSTRLTFIGTMVTPNGKRRVDPNQRSMA